MGVRRSDVRLCVLVLLTFVSTVFVLLAHNIGLQSWPLQIQQKVSFPAAFGIL